MSIAPPPGDTSIALWAKNPSALFFDSQFFQLRLRILKNSLGTVRRGSIVYTEKFRNYDTLMFCGYRHLRVDHKEGMLR